LGFTVADLSRLTGLSAAQIKRRESSAWAMKRGSIESDECWRYITFLAHARGLPRLLDPLEQS
jgi:hypothetical protein